jgi:hypothetical protein
VTHHELARWWGGCGVVTARQWIGALDEEVPAVDVNGEQAWMLAADAREVRVSKMNVWRSDPQRAQVMQFGQRRSTMKLIILKRRGRIAS